MQCTCTTLPLNYTLICLTHLSLVLPVARKGTMARNVNYSIKSPLALLQVSIYVGCFELFLLVQGVPNFLSSKPLKIGCVSHIMCQSKFRVYFLMTTRNYMAPPTGFLAPVSKPLFYTDCLIFCKYL